MNTILPTIFASSLSRITIALDGTVFRAGFWVGVVSATTILMLVYLYRNHQPK